MELLVNFLNWINKNIYENIFNLGEKYLEV